MKIKMLKKIQGIYQIINTNIQYNILDGGKFTILLVKIQENIHL